jgi:hypothetical protein
MYSRYNKDKTCLSSKTPTCLIYKTLTFMLYDLINHPNIMGAHCSCSQYYNLYITNFITSICTKTNTNLLHTNLLHSILHKIGHVIQIVVHSEKKRPPLITRYAGIRRISTKEEKNDPL